MIGPLLDQPGVTARQAGHAAGHQPRRRRARAEPLRPAACAAGSLERLVFERLRQLRSSACPTGRPRARGGRGGPPRGPPRGCATGSGPRGTPTRRSRAPPSPTSAASSPTWCCGWPSERSGGRMRASGRSGGSLRRRWPRARRVRVRGPDRSAPGGRRARRPGRPGRLGARRGPAAPRRHAAQPTRSIRRSSTPRRWWRASAGDMRRQLQRVTVEYATSELGRRRAAPAGADGLRHPELRRRRPEPRAAPARLPGLAAAGRRPPTGRAARTSTTTTRGGLPLARRRHGAGAERRRAAEPARLPLSALRPAVRLRATAHAATDSTRAGLDRAGCRAACAVAGTDLRHAACGSRAAPPPPRRVRTGAVRPARTVYRVQIAAVGSRKAADDAAKQGSPARPHGGDGRSRASLQGAGGRVPDARGRPDRRGQPQGQARRQSVRRLGALNEPPCRRARCGSRSAF